MTHHNNATNASTETDPWADIRPFMDHEVADVLARLSRDNELLDALTRFRLPRMARWAPSLARVFASRAVRREAVHARLERSKKHYQTAFGRAHAVHSVVHTFPVGGGVRLCTHGPTCVHSSGRRGYAAVSPPFAGA